MKKSWRDRNVPPEEERRPGEEPSDEIDIPKHPSLMRSEGTLPLISVFF